MGKDSLMSPESEKSGSRGARRIVEVVGAALGLALAGPLLTVVIPLAGAALLLCACVAAATVYAPIAIVKEGPRWATQTAEADATITTVAQFESLEATATAYPLPPSVQTLVEADAASRWTMSPDGEHVAIAFWDQDRLGVMQLGTRQTRFVDLPEVPAKYAYYRDMRRSDPLWLDDRRLVISLPDFSGEDSDERFRLVELDDQEALELKESRLQEVEAAQVTDSQLDGKELFDVSSFYLSNLKAVAVDETGGLAIVGRDEEARLALSRRGPNTPVKELGPAPEWRFLERYYAPDGAYYAAVWPNGERLAILTEGGHIATETLAQSLGPPQVKCELQPIGWMPDSSGVLFWARCEANNPISQKAILILPVLAK
jgi:hypothetical protein